MVVVYDSLTGQSKRFAHKLELDVYNIKDYAPKEDETILLITRSFNFGEISKEAHQFLEKYHHQVKGVCVSGNRNWGTNYGAAGDKIRDIYGIPLVLKFEGSGMEHEVSIALDWIKVNQ